MSGTGTEVVPNLPKCRVRVCMSYQAYQSVGYGYGCLYPYPYVTPCISTRSYPVPGYFAAGVPNSVGYGYGCRTELTKGTGAGMDVLRSLPKGRVWYRCLYPYPYPTPGVSTRQNRTRYQGILPRAYRTYQSVGYG